MPATDVGLDSKATPRGRISDIYSTPLGGHSDRGVPGAHRSRRLAPYKSTLLAASGGVPVAAATP